MTEPDERARAGAAPGLFDAPLPRRLGDIQLALHEGGHAGWLLYDHRRQSPLVARVLGLDHRPPEGRYFYWVPPLDIPALVVHEADEGGLPALPGEVLTYASYAELRRRLEKIVPNKGRVLMEHSEVAAVPDLSRVDGGTLELVRGIGAASAIEIQSSRDFVNRFFGPWSDTDRALHARAQALLGSVRPYCEALLLPGVRESEVLDEARRALCRAGLLGPPPQVTFGPHTKRRTHRPVGEDDRALARGDTIRIELYGRLSGGPYAHSAVTYACQPPPPVRQRFERVARAKARAIELLAERFSAGTRTLGYEIDRAMNELLDARPVVRGGHHLGWVPWSSEAVTFDDTEIHDTRETVEGTAWSVHPTLFSENDAIRVQASVRRVAGALEILDLGQTELLEVG